jgi:hypothetical protein
MGIKTQLDKATSGRRFAGYPTIMVAIIVIAWTGSNPAFAQSLNWEGQTRRVRYSPSLFGFKRECDLEHTGGFLSLSERWSGPGRIPSGINYHGRLQPGRVRLHRKSSSRWKHPWSKHFVERRIQHVPCQGQSVQGASRRFARFVHALGALFTLVARNRSA